MCSDVYTVEIQISKDGSQWKRVTGGTWHPGSNEPLRLHHGEPIPQDAIDGLIGIDPSGQESGTFHAKVGGVDFRMNFSK